jgi:integrase
MARKVRDKDLGDRTSRERLEIRGKLHYRQIEKGLHIGYRRLRGKSGTWTARFYDDTKRKYEWEVIGTADDRSDADGVTVHSFDQAVEKARALRLKRAKLAAGIHGPITVDQAMNAYVTKLDQDGMSSRENVEKMIAKYVTPLIGDLDVASLTTERLNDWKADVAKMPARGRKFDERARRATANRTLVMLRAGLNLAYEAKKVPSDAAWRAVKKFKGVDRKRDRFLSLDEAKRLVNAAGDDFRPMIEAALHTGCRYAELCNLVVADYDADNKTLSIRKSKSGRERHVYLTDEGVQLFAQLAAGRKRSDPLIRRADGLPFGMSHQIRRMQIACQRARIEPAVSFHILRHSYASALVKAGVPLAYVAESLGHTSIAMVQKHYGHIAKSHLADTIRANVPSYGFAKTNVRTLKRS